MESSYSPVAYVHREVIEEEIARKTNGRIFYFDLANELTSIDGTIARMEEIPGNGIYIFLHPEGKVRIDRIVTVFGKPGAAFDEYDAYGNACMECHGAWHFED